jgi:hypothetical protein
MGNKCSTSTLPHTFARMTSNMRTYLLMFYSCDHALFCHFTNHPFLPLSPLHPTASSECSLLGVFQSYLRHRGRPGLKGVVATSCLAVFSCSSLLAYGRLS